jgi:hypothetical protein
MYYPVVPKAAMNFYNCKLLLLNRLHSFVVCDARAYDNMEHAHHPHGGSIRWATAKHALRCLIGCNNIGEGIGAAV